MVVLSNGHVHAFGNNFYAQFGYDFREETYKENQTSPCLLQYMVHWPVRQVACGDKHSVFLYTSGAAAVVGNNSHGQIGDGTRAESQVPKTVDIEVTLSQVASGPNHVLALSDGGDVYCWGYSKGCGHRRCDVLSPELKLTSRGVLQLAAGGTHSMALTATGLIYAWGFGVDGELGLGDRRVAVAQPRLIRHEALRGQVSYIAAGEAYSAAITEAGKLYTWGKSSHVIEANGRSSEPHFQPVCLNPDLGPVHSVHCGTWHALALAGLPDLRPRLPDEAEFSDSSDSDPVMTSEGSTPGSRAGSLSGNDKRPVVTVHADDTFGHSVAMETSTAPAAHMTTPTSRSASSSLRLSTLPARGTTKLTLGEFYAMSDSSPSLQGSPRTPSQASEGSKHTPEKEKQVKKVSPSDSQSEKAPTPGSTHEEPVIENTKENDTVEETLKSPVKRQSSASSSSTTRSAVSESSLKKRMAENFQSNNNLKFGNSRGRRRLTPSRTVASIPIVGSPTGERSPKCLTPASSAKSSRNNSGVGERSHTMFISKSTAEHFSLPRERSCVSKQSVALVDFNQLRAGSLFDSGNENENDVVSPLLGLSNFSSPRMDALTQATDLEVQDILSQRTPDKLRITLTHVTSSDTPSAMARQLRSHEMLGRPGHLEAAMHPPFATPSPRLGLFTKGTDYDVMEETNLKFMRSKTSMGPVGRGPSRFYRKPGLPGATGRPPAPVKPPKRQMTQVGGTMGSTAPVGHGVAPPQGRGKFAPAQNLASAQPSLEISTQGRTPEERLAGQNHIRAKGNPNPQHQTHPNAPLTDLGPGSARLRGVQSQPEPRNSHKGTMDDVMKRRAVYSSASSWRQRSVTSLGNDIILSSTLKPVASTKKAGNSVDPSMTSFVSGPSTFPAKSRRAGNMHGVVLANGVSGSKCPVPPNRKQKMNMNSELSSK
ncbi:X-linked retinitis pigmentosa GTPase regulator [Aplysia californica]|uniref:X-linked retinitis pigmentosa GTPase regulator n=1 Tax=Aplysia californica TaxID=6500 RepID=A0ABM0JDS7_APLCA|nr:X-linked retinitis pigmentosa GTPase regulator [Aplysia californica]